MPFTKTLTEPSRTDLPFPKKQATASAAPIPQAEKGPRLVDRQVPPWTDYFKE